MGYQYQLTALGSLGPLGSAPPMTLRQLLDHLDGDEAALELVRAILLSDDLMQREAVLAGEIDQAQPVVLTVQQATNNAPLPDELAPARDGSKIPGDAVWDAYFRHVRSVAGRLRSEFLDQWAAFEVSLRNALAAARAKALGLDASHYTVAADLSGGDKFESVIGEWAAAPDPMAALKAIDRARWEWLRQNDKWFSFNRDELAAYAAKLMMLHRWHRLSSPARDQ